MKPFAFRPALQIRQGAQNSLEDALIVEEPLEVRIDGRRYTATMRTPGETSADDLLLAQGLLFSEGVISGLDDIEKIEWGARCRDLSDELVPVVNVTLHDSDSVPAHLWERSIISNSSCGLCGKASVEALSARFEPLPDTALNLEILRDLPDVMRPHQRLFDRTGGCHAAALFDARGELLCCYEDIGRHNATDKALGFGLENGFIPAREPLTLLVSGRASFEIVQKALVARIQTVCSVSAASSLAVDLAARNNLHLVGFLRPRGLTVYTPHQIPALNWRAMNPNYQPEIVVQEHNGCGENPLYDEARGALYWCDINSGKIFALNVASGAHRLVYQGAECGAFTLQSDGNLLIFPGHDALILDAESGQTTPIKSGIVSDTGRFNDCIVAPDGRIFAGTVDWEKQTRGALFDLGLDLTPQSICSGTACSNGLAWTPNLDGLYWADSSAKTVSLFDYDATSGALSNRRQWLHTPGETPDGLTIDRDGNLWIAFYDGGCVRHYDSQARLKQQVDLPVPNVTSCVFGGPDFGDLYITSAAQGNKNHAVSGALFRIRPEVGGKAEFRSHIGIK